MARDAVNAGPRAIGQVAASFDLPAHVLRHWEDVGLLRPDRDAAGRRRYTEGDVARIAVIVRSKAAGLSLEQIGVLLDRGALDRHRVLEAHIAELDARTAAIAASRAMAEHALRCRAHDIAQCPGFQAALQHVLDGGDLDRSAPGIGT